MYSLGQEMGPVHCFSIWAWCQVCISSPKSALTLPTLFCLVLMTAQLGTFVVLRSKWQTIGLHEWKSPWSYGWTPRVNSDGVYDAGIRRHPTTPLPEGLPGAVCTCPGTAVMEAGHLGSQHVHFKPKFTPLVFIWVIMIFMLYIGLEYFICPHIPDSQSQLCNF